LEVSEANYSTPPRLNRNNNLSFFWLCTFSLFRENEEPNFWNLKISCFQRPVLISSSNWELASCELDRDKFIYLKFGNCKVQILKLI
jgi:hypothetical protein